MMVYRRIDTQELWRANNPHHQLLGVKSTVHHVENTKKNSTGILSEASGRMVGLMRRSMLFTYKISRGGQSWTRQALFA